MVVFRPIYSKYDGILINVLFDFYSGFYLQAHTVNVENIWFVIILF
jgi:hypothetical protein